MIKWPTQRNIRDKGLVIFTASGWSFQLMRHPISVDQMKELLVFTQFLNHSPGNTQNVDLYPYFNDLNWESFFLADKPGPFTMAFHLSSL